MVDKEKEPQIQDPEEIREWIKLEYQECVSAGRFIFGLRFSFFVSFVTFFALLVTGYQFAWSKKDAFGALHPFLLTLISFFGILITIAALLIEERNISLYRACDQRAAELEKKEMKRTDSIRQILSSTKASLFLYLFDIEATHTRAIKIIYVSILVTWFVLFLYSVSQIILY